MRIIHAVRQFHPGIGGLENVVADLAAAQARNGHKVSVVTLDHVFDAGKKRPLPPHQIIDGVEITRIPFFGSKRYPIAWSLIRHVKDADIVHVHGLDFFFDYLAVTAPLHHRKLVVSTHGGFFHTSFAATLKRIYFATITRLSLRCYAAVATVGIADDRLFRRIRQRGISLIENGVNVDKYANASSKTATRTVLSIGRFSRNKRLDRVIAFVAALRRRDPRWTLKIVGRAWDLSVSDLHVLAKAAGISEATEIFDSPRDHEVRTIMGCGSVIASASEYEGFGLAAVEGMSAGLFPVLNDILPFRRLVEKTGVGMIVDFADVQTAVDQVLARWDEICGDYQRHREAAMAASAEYGWHRVNEKYEALYQSALGTKIRSILDVGVEVATFAAARDLLDERFRRRDQAVVTFANAHTLNRLRTDPRSEAVARKSIIFNDGVGVDIASWLLFGEPFPENLNGTDFVPRYLKETANRYRVFLLGAKPAVVERAASHLANLAPKHTIVGAAHGYFAPEDVPHVINEIRAARADVLLVAMGNLDQELWLTDHLTETGCVLGFGVGGLFDFIAGVVPRAPQWVRAVHLEWLYRMVQEPRRLWRRYLVGMPIFLIRVAGQWLAGARVPSAARE